MHKGLALHIFFYPNLKMISKYKCFIITTVYTYGNNIENEIKKRE